MWGSSTRRIGCIDCHCGGEPARVVVSGVPKIPGSTMMEKRRWMMENFDALRKILLLEPRGYPCQNANVLLPPTQPDAAYGYVILEQGKIYPAMSGHNSICVATALLETGMVPMQDPITHFVLEAPAGLIPIRAQCSNGKATNVTLRNVPSFVGLLDVEVVVPTLGKVRCDIAFGGMWYCIVDAASVGLTLVPSQGKRICQLGEMIKTACREQHPVQHPEYDYPGCDIICFRAPPSEGSGAHARNTVVMSNGVLDWEDESTWTGMIDRSPCGTGTSAVMAVLHARGELEIGADFVHESIVGSKFVGRLVEETTVGKDKVPAVIPEVTGQAWITQHVQVVVHPTDPFPEGFTVGDIWAS